MKKNNNHSAQHDETTSEEVINVSEINYSNNNGVNNNVPGVNNKNKNKIKQKIIPIIIRDDPPPGTDYPENRAKNRTRSMGSILAKSGCNSNDVMVEKNDSKIDNNANSGSNNNNDDNSNNISNNYDNNTNENNDIKDNNRDKTSVSTSTCTGSVMTCSDKIAKWNALGNIMFYYSFLLLLLFS